MFDPLPSIFAILPPIEDGIGRRTRYVSAGLSDAMEALLVCDSTASGTISLLAASNSDGDNSTVIWTNSFGGSGTEVQRVTIVPNSDVYDPTRPYFSIEIGDGIENTAAIITGTGRVIVDDISSDVGVEVVGDIPTWVEALRSPQGDLPILAAQMSHVPPRYWFNGAECVVGDIFEHNVDWGDFSFADIVSGVGLTSTGEDGSGPAFTASVFTALSSGFTCVRQSQWDSGVETVYSYMEIADAPSYASYFSDFLVGRNDANNMGIDIIWKNDGSVTDIDDYIPAVPGIRKCAATWDGGTHTAGSFNGRTVIISNNTEIVAPFNIIGLWSYDLPFQSIYFYPPQPEADLPELSTP